MFSLSLWKLYRLRDGERGGRRRRQREREGDLTDLHKSVCQLRLHSFQLRVCLAKHSHSYSLYSHSLALSRIHTVYSLWNWLAVVSSMPRRLLVWWCSSCSNLPAAFWRSSCSVTLLQQLPPQVAPGMRRRNREEISITAYRLSIFSCTKCEIWLVSIQRVAYELLLLFIAFVTCYRIIDYVIAYRYIILNVIKVWLTGYFCDFCVSNMLSNNRLFLSPIDT